MIANVSRRIISCANLFVASNYVELLLLLLLLASCSCSLSTVD